MWHGRACRERQLPDCLIQPLSAATKSDRDECHFHYTTHDLYQPAVDGERQLRHDPRRRCMTPGGTFVDQNEAENREGMHRFASSLSRRHGLASMTLAAVIFAGCAPAPSTALHSPAPSKAEAATTEAMVNDVALQQGAHAAIATRRAQQHDGAPHLHVVGQRTHPSARAPCCRSGSARRRWLPAPSPPAARGAVVTLEGLADLTGACWCGTRKSR